MNPFVEKYKKTLAHRALDRQAKEYKDKGAGVPSSLRRDAIKKAKKK